MKTIEKIIRFVNSAEFHDSVYASIKPYSEFDRDAGEVNPFAPNYSAHNILTRFAAIIKLMVECEPVTGIIDNIEWSDDIDELFDRYAEYAPRWDEYTTAEKRDIEYALEAAISLREIVEPMINGRCHEPAL